MFASQYSAPDEQAQSDKTGEIAAQEV